MKLSVSLPEHIAKEIRGLAKKSDRSVSWWIQRAWTVARDELHNPKESQKALKTALEKLDKLEGSVKKDFPKSTAVELSHSAFKHKR